jgi:hypothetical protein
MKRNAIFVAKFAAVWLALIIGQIAGGVIGQILIHAATPAFKPDGPFDLMTAMLISSGLYALVLSAMASQMRWGFRGRAISLFILLYVLESLLSEIEAIYFNTYLHMSNSLLVSMAVGAAIKAAIVALVCAALWRGGGQPVERFSGLAWKIPAIIPLYVVFYFGAGALIAWQSADVRAYYAQGFHIDQGQLALLQVGRGLIWALLTGAAFSVLMALPLLYPNPLMPWPVRQVHLVEVGVSNFLFGVVVSLLLLWGAGLGASRPVTPHLKASLRS